MVECKDCKYIWWDDRGPEMCGNKEAKKFFKTISNPEYVFGYCARFSPKGDCRFYKSKLIKKITGK